MIDFICNTPAGTCESGEKPENACDNCEHRVRVWHGCPICRGVGVVPGRLTLESQ